jgi:hypothetical protein
MIHRLAAVFPRVDHHAKAVGKPLLPREIRSNPKQMPEQSAMFFSGLGQRNHVLPRRNQNMRRRLRIDVFEGVAFVVLINRTGRNAPLNDLAKEAAHNGNSVQENFGADFTTRVDRKPI